MPTRLSHSPAAFCSMKLVPVFPIRGYLGIAKLLAKFDAIPLFGSFRHFAITDNPTSVHNTYTVIDRLPATDAFYRQEKIHACA